MTFENALKGIVNGLSNATSLDGKYFVLFNANGTPVEKIRADKLHTNGYGYVIVGTLD